MRTEGSLAIINGALCVNGVAVKSENDIVYDNCALCDSGIALIINVNGARYLYDMSDCYWEIESPDPWDVVRCAVRCVAVYAN